ncbi:MAG TPA: aromatic ring-hydroxylating dioxygenase subunit alpha [Rhodocyclaceae bacterium]|nr:aromatic ring-hydroxylating dioxygenase subunit alpha [Rhodocyclaceae bacterium]
MIDPKRCWWPLTLLTELNAGKPVARSLHGIPLVLFRDADGQPVALHDRCPHRHAPLSCGNVQRGKLACPYHGWRFAADGRCTDIPGMSFEGSRNTLVPTVSTRAAHGLVWACLALNDTTPAPIAPAVIDGIDWFFMTETVQCEIAEAAENFLDGFHTHFVHAGWIRRDSKRQTVKSEVRRLADGIEARYSDEGLQSGLISSLLEGSRTESFGRFRLPGIAEVEYRGKHGLNLLITAWLTPETAGRLRIHARVATRRGLTPAWLKRAFLRRLFGIILQQDKKILEQTNANIARFDKRGLQAPLLDTSLDLLGPSIRRLLVGEVLDDSVEHVLTFRI